jgi:hypothetical protein
MDDTFLFYLTLINLQVWLTYKPHLSFNVNGDFHWILLSVGWFGFAIRKPSPLRKDIQC